MSLTESIKLLILGLLVLTLGLSLLIFTPVPSSTNSRYIANAYSELSEFGLISTFLGFFYSLAGFITMAAECKRKLTSYLRPNSIYEDIENRPREMQQRTRLPIVNNTYTEESSLVAAMNEQMSISASSANSTENIPTNTINDQDQDKKILQRLFDNDSTLTSLELKSSRISNDNIKDFAKALAGNSNLTKLDLSDNQIKDIDMEVIAPALASNSTLKILHLNNNLVRDIGAEALELALFKNNSLTEIALYNNKLYYAGAKALAKSLLSKHNALTRLYLGNNNIRNDGAEEFALAITNNVNLTLLDLSDNKIGDEGVKALAEALKKNITLTTLNLRYNNISAAVNAQIESLIKRNQGYLEQLQAAACEQVRLIRILVYKTNSKETEQSLFLLLPIELRGKIVKHTSEKSHFTAEQRRLILNYAEGNIAPVADKLSFFKVTKCDRVRKQLNQVEIEAASYSHASTV